MKTVRWFCLLSVLLLACDEDKLVLPPASHAGVEGQPPHLITDQALHQTLDERFLLVDSFQPEDSDLGRVGAERWYVWRKRPDPDPV